MEQFGYLDEVRITPHNALHDENKSFNSCIKKEQRKNRNVENAGWESMCQKHSTC